MDVEESTVRSRDRFGRKKRDALPIDSPHEEPEREQKTLERYPEDSLSSPPTEQRAIEYTEHVAHVIRLRKGIGLGAIIWPAFSVADFLVDAFIIPGSLYHLLAIRFATWPLIVFGVAVLYRPKTPSPFITRLVNVGVFGVGSFALALMCVFSGGFESIYFAGIHLVLVCRGAFVEENWRAAILPHTLMVGSYPLVLFGSTLFSDLTAAQLRDSRSLSVFAVYLCFIVSTSLLTVLGSHVIWNLRRQVFESRNIGRYRLKRRLGQGGMGEVWAAHDKTLKRDVAIKILRAQIRRRGTARTSIERFKREVQATCELTHPNTVRVFDYGVTEDGLWYYAMELLEGEHLGSLIHREGPLPPDRAVRLITQATRALAEAHAAGIVHRDVKPANLFVANLGGESDFLKVLDFGLARLPKTSVEGTLTETGAFAGTPSYLSPEVIRGRQADSRSDVYALGAVLYETLCGHAPFESDDTSSLLFSHINEVPAPPSEKLGSSLPESLESIVMRCLEKNADARYRSAAELAASLTGLEPHQR